MSSLPSRVYLAVRDVDDGARRTGDPAEPASYPERIGAPVVPGSWWVEHWQRAGPWWRWTRPSDGAIVVAARCNAVGARGLYAIAGSVDWLEELAAGNDEVMPGREAWRRRAEATPRQIVRAWRWWRCDVTERATQSDVDMGRAASLGDPVQRDGVVRTLSAEGVLLPDPTSETLPWDLDATGGLTTQAAAVMRVRALHRPALGVAGLCGVSLWQVLEDEPDRGG